MQDNDSQVLLDDMERTGMNRDEMDDEYERTEWERKAMKEK